MSELSDKVKRLAQERLKRIKEENPSYDREAYVEKIRKAKEISEARTVPREQKKKASQVFKVVRVFHTDDMEELKRSGLAETPALVSPMWTTASVCPGCKQTIPPLVYGVGHTTRTAHTGSKCPGIYTTPDSPVYERPSPGTALLSGILSEDTREFTGTRAHYLACQRCKQADIKGTITSKGYVSCSECALPTHPIGWEIEEDGNGGSLHFTLNPAYKGEVAPGLERALESSGLDQGMSVDSSEAMDRIQNRLNKMKRRLGK